MKTEDIRDFEGLCGRIYGKKSGVICHYTSFESLIMILKNRSLQLTRYDLLNDMAERNLSKCYDGDYRYIISFTGTSSENVAMWALYGKHSSLKVRLKFSRSVLIHSADDNFYFDAQKNKKIQKYDTSSVSSDCSKKGFSISDIVYYDRERNKFKLSGNTLNICVDNNMISALSGTIKYDAWEYERESRLSVIMHQNNCSNQRVLMPHLYVGLTDEFIKKLSITYSPWINNTVFDELTKSIDNLAGCRLVHKRSSLQGEVAEL